MFSFKQPKGGIIGHRGAAALEAENTLRSFARAKQDGAECIEFDVKLTKDGQMVIFHDDHLDRITNGKGPLSDFTLAQLKELIVKGPGDREDKKEGNKDENKETNRIPTFEETVHLAEKLNLNMNIEIKDDKENGLKIAKLIAEYINEQWPKNQPMPLVSSFIHANILEFRKCCPEVAIGFLVETPTEEVIELVKQTPNASLNIGDPKTPVESLLYLINHPFKIFIYTVNDKIRVKALIDAGVFAIFTDNPGEMLRP